jgi:hypothetical protein
VTNYGDTGVDVESLSLETRHRECRDCKHIQVRQFVNW